MTLAQRIAEALAKADCTNYQHVGGVRIGGVINTDAAAAIIDAELAPLIAAAQAAETLLSQQLDEYNQALSVMPRKRATPGPILTALRAALLGDSDAN